MRHNNIAIFIPHSGCKNLCSFCNQRTISGTQKPPTIKEVDDILSKAYNEIENKNETEIAFFGGSFTAINKEYMVSLLETANRYIGENKFSGIRISTRPDCINDEILTLLKNYHVTSIELGAQSMIDEVLIANNRGHTAYDVVKSANLIKKYGFSLGLQMMVGLYLDTEEFVYQTAKKIADLSPDTVRIYPTVVLKSTKLAELYLNHQYEIMPLEKAVEICANLLIFFEERNIKVIKLGLHSSVEVEKDMVAGIYHPAFHELCQSRIYYQKAMELLKEKPLGRYILQVNSSSVSQMIGQNKSNIIKLQEKGYAIKIEPSDHIKKFEILIKQ